MAVYNPDVVDLTPAQHGDAKEVSDLIDALVNKDGTALKEAGEALMALLPDVISTDRFLHLYKVFKGALDFQLIDRFISPAE
jgi:hypothetical protein